MPKPKSKTNTFTFVRGLFGETSKPSALKVDQRKADEEVLDRAASVSLALAEHLAPQAIAEDDPVKASTVLGAIREARECVKARRDVTGGGLAGGTQSQPQTSTGVTMLVEHQGLPVSDDFNADIAATNADLAVPPRSQTS